jgi:hypothetical protein
MPYPIDVALPPGATGSLDDAPGTFQQLGALVTKATTGQSLLAIPGDTTGEVHLLLQAGQQEQLQTSVDGEAYLFGVLEVSLDTVSAVYGDLTGSGTVEATKQLLDLLDQAKCTSALAGLGDLTLDAASARRIGDAAFGCWTSASESVAAVVASIVGVAAGALDSLEQSNWGITDSLIGQSFHVLSLSRPAVPAPVQPAPVKPAPVQPAPVQPAPVKPAPVQPAPVQPVPVQPVPVQPVPVQPVPADPNAPPSTDPGQTPLPGNAVNLGGVNLETYCQDGWGMHAELRYHNTWGWRCAVAARAAAGQQPGDQNVSIDDACAQQYTPTARSRYSAYTDPSSWFCWTVPTPTDSAPPVPVAPVAPTVYVHQTTADQVPVQACAGIRPACATVRWIASTGGEVDVVCQASGGGYDTANGGTSPPVAHVWDRQPDGTYVPDYWVNTANTVFDGFDPGIPRC